MSHCVRPKQTGPIKTDVEISQTQVIKKPLALQYTDKGNLDGISHPIYKTEESLSMELMTKKLCQRKVDLITHKELKIFFPTAGSFLFKIPVCAAFLNDVLSLTVLAVVHHTLGMN